MLKMSNKDCENTFLNFVGSQFLINCQFRLKRFNITLHSIMHDIYQYNKTLTRRKANQIRESLRVDDLFDNITDLENGYMSVLNYYKEHDDCSSDVKEEICNCNCHFHLENNQETTICRESKTFFHNVFCISNCSKSNVSFRNYLMANNICSSNIAFENLKQDANLNSPSLTGKTFVEENEYTTFSFNNFVTNLKTSISPKIKKMFLFHNNNDRYGKMKKKDKANTDLEIGLYEEIEILHNNNNNELIISVVDKEENILKDESTSNCFFNNKNDILEEAYHVNNFDQSYRIEVISR
ncbi:hypothetical protein HANVADRAFT_7733 [Hanseniaspora valbyensis NRRL Y-1626]|uniref:Uncharacterized protein n=1 Tax=Hanseniaspora valbyensis NRRL Y-1626 TaxID=766949 RepID=A0A1B7TAM0_9ASCO|nr:hypothetical protein HANVADRAFT_7733 [Hanseniaspora valbyensis NRRL Y-1626]